MAITSLKIPHKHTINFGLTYAKVVLMNSQNGESRRHLTEKKLRSNLQKEAIQENLEELMESLTLRKVPLEERRREAEKPLFLTRYE
jgi:hypothetical protein